jgi:hypothetical protein
VGRILAFTRYITEASKGFAGKNNQANFVPPSVKELKSCFLILTPERSIPALCIRS